MEGILEGLLPPQKPSILAITMWNTLQLSAMKNPAMHILLLLRLQRFLKERNTDVIFKKSFMLTTLSSFRFPTRNTSTSSNLEGWNSTLRQGWLQGGGKGWRQWIEYIRDRRDACAEKKESRG